MYGHPSPKKREAFIEEHKPEIKLLEINEAILRLATLYQEKLELPYDAREDGLHLALSVEYRIEYLLTWNLKHFARHERKEQIRRLNKQLNKYQPNIVTPQDMISD
jgi:predicted nucleic acid-binding protein